MPTFFLGYLGEHVRRERGRRLERRATAATADRGAPATGSREDEDGWLHFEGRGDDVIVSAGYRIGPFEVESALVAHPAVAEAAAVAAPDEERGAVVRAVVVLRDGARRPAPQLARELQEHVKRETAPYKYPRIVEFAARAAEDGQRQDQARRAATSSGLPPTLGRRDGQPPLAGADAAPGCGGAAAGRHLGPRCGGRRRRCAQALASLVVHALAPRPPAAPSRRRRAQDAAKAARMPTATHAAATR